jgi:hypothetical protein
MPNTTSTYMLFRATSALRRSVSGPSASNSLITMRVVAGAVAIATTASSSEGKTRAKAIEASHTVTRTTPGPTRRKLDASKIAPNVEQDQAERDLAQKSERREIVVRDQIESRRADQQTDGEITGDFRNVQDLRDVPGDQRRDQDQADGQNFVHGSASKRAKKR